MKLDKIHKPIVKTGQEWIEFIYAFIHECEASHVEVTGLDDYVIFEELPEAIEGGEWDGEKWTYGPVTHFSLKFSVPWEGGPCTEDKCNRLFYLSHPPCPSCAKLKEAGE